MENKRLSAMKEKDKNYKFLISYSKFFDTLKVKFTANTDKSQGESKNSKVKEQLIFDANFYVGFPRGKKDKK